MCLLKSDGKSCAAYKVFKYIFYIGSAKKKIDLKEKEKGHLLHQHGLVICHLFANQKSISSSLHMKRDPFVVCGYNKSPVLKVNYQKKRDTHCHFFIVSYKVALQSELQRACSVSCVSVSSIEN